MVENNCMDLAFRFQEPFVWCVQVTQIHKHGKGFSFIVVFFRGVSHNSCWSICELVYLLLVLSYGRTTNIEVKKPSCIILLHELLTTRNNCLFSVVSNTDLNEGTLGGKIFDCLPTSGSYPSAHTYELSKCKASLDEEKFSNKRISIHHILVSLIWLFIWQFAYCCSHMSFIGSFILWIHLLISLSCMYPQSLAA